MSLAEACGGLLVFLAGCAKSSGQCNYQRPACPGGTVCAFVTQQTSRCIPMASLDAPVSPPFAAGEVFRCTQGGRTPAGRSHSFQGDVFALDLSAPRDAEVTVVSPVRGTAVVFDGCEERHGESTAHNSSSCGLGYGNHVRVWDGHELYLLGHLARVLVAPGPVERGQPLGVMGVSGLAGHRHVHLVVTRPAAEADVKSILENPGWKGPIPVRFRLAARHARDGELETAAGDALRCGEGPGEADDLEPSR